MRRSFVISGLFLAALSCPRVWGAPDPLAYFPITPMEKEYGGLGGKIHVQERVLPVPSPDALRRFRVSRAIVYLNFPPRTIVSTYSFDPATGALSKQSSTSAFSSTLFQYHPPLVRLMLPFRKGAAWSGSDGQNRIHDRVYGKVRVTLPAGTFVCWVVRRRISYDLISRRSEQILYEYYARGLGFVGEGGWSATGRWHWSRELLSYRAGGSGSPFPGP